MIRPVHCLLVLLAACASPVSSATTLPARGGTPARTATELDTVPHAPSLVNVSGTWATGSTGEPAVRQVTVQGECNATPALWLLQQDGDSVRLYRFAAFHAQGVPSSPVSHIVAVGRVSGVSVTMDGPDARFALRYDSTSGHLRGTLNGAPFWAVPLAITQPEHCIPLP